MRSKFREGQLVIYQKGDNFEVGRIKILKNHGAFVYYTKGSTSTLTAYEDMKPIANEYCLGNTMLGGTGV